MSDDAAMRAVRRGIVGRIEIPSPFPNARDVPHAFRAVDELSNSHVAGRGPHGNDATDLCHRPDPQQTDYNEFAHFSLHHFREIQHK